MKAAITPDLQEFFLLICKLRKSTGLHIMRSS